MEAASEPKPVMVTVTETQAELHVAQQAWLKVKHIGIVVLKEAGPLYIKPTKRPSRQGSLMPAKCSMKVHSNVPSFILVANLMNIIRHVPNNMVSCPSSDSTVSSINPDQSKKERCHTVDPVQTTSKPPIEEMKAPMPQMPASIRWILSVYLQNTPLIVLELSARLKNTKKSGCASWTNQERHT